MPIQLDELLKPISPDQPCGIDLRYAPVADQIREARRQDDAIAQGVWKTDVKAADYVLVIKLARQALTKQGKDLQVAAWLTEALLMREGAPGLLQGLTLVQRLLQEYWETVHPRIDEDGDVDMRATPLRWVASQLDPAVRSQPITAGGTSWTRYKESRKVPLEADAQSNSEKSALRQELLEDGKLSPEAFEEDFESTPTAFYERLLVDLESNRQAVADLATFCDEKFGEDAPDFGPLRTALEEVRQTVHILCTKKGGRLPGQEGEAEPEEEPAGQAREATEAPVEAVAETAVQQPAARAAAQKRRPATAEPQDANDAMERMASLAHYLRRENIGNPVPYLVLRSLRWGELRAAGSFFDPSLAVAPPTEVRVELKRLANECNWEQVIHAGEQAMAEPCGRVWLDLQRYVVRACRNNGQDYVAQAICSALKGLLADYPQLPDFVLADDTPAANAETKDWLREENLLGGVEQAAAQPEPPPQPMWTPPPEPAAETPDGAPVVDTYQLAMDAARSGQADEAIRLMLAEIGHEHSGRGRFLRRSQLVQICIATGNDGVALPILQELADEISQRRLEEWESPEMLSQPLGMLYSCLQSADGADPRKQELYARICRLDPLRALNLPK